MLLEQDMLQLLIFVFIELVIITAVAASLLIALVAMISKSDKKNASLPDREVHPKIWTNKFKFWRCIFDG